MFSRASLRTVFAVAVIFSLLAASFVTAADLARDKDQVRWSKRGISNGPSTLDDEYTQLRYVKTTDYGVTWTPLTEAGDLSTVMATEAGLPDFDAVVADNNELCFAVGLADAPTPGIYAVPGPDFVPVLAVEQGTNDFFSVGNSSGWSTIGRTPNGDLFILVWGLNSTGAATFWAVKSTNDGLAWGTPFPVATEPALPATAAYPHISQMNSADWCFVVFQDEAFTQYAMRFPTAGGAGTITNTGGVSGSEFSYYTANCQPIACDPEHSALYFCYRSTDLSGAAISYSGDQGGSWSAQAVTGGQRYPNMALNAATQTPYVVSNFGLPASGAFHTAWYAKDDGGYNGGLWTDPVVFATAPDPFDGTGPLLYQNQMHWWDADRGVASENLWGAFTPNGSYSSYTTDGGTSWTGFSSRWDYITDMIDAASTQNNGLAGGTDGVAYIFTAGKTGFTDTEGPAFSAPNLVTPPTNAGPWTIEITVTDFGNDTSDVWLSYYRVEGEEDTLEFTNFNVTDPESNSGVATFVIPTTDPAGVAWATGDSIKLYFWSRDLTGNAGASDMMILVVGNTFLGVNEHLPIAVESFRLIGNYPNPFNPSTRIAFDLPGTAPVTLKVYNTMGQEVATVLNGDNLVQGRHTIAFDASHLSAGVYFYTLNAGPYSATQKMVLVK